ncbi:unnamed protein product [Schistocephalus solidus]|uniref:Endo/exonuclease/phosphatase domain-containing protein n=1 Tax=Schistocephalus solidus TaxID=70667 RepID=A0A183TQR3_SCHSO|nr:unnamed protein product [Schistocephalus solidus]
MVVNVRTGISVVDRAHALFLEYEILWIKIKTNCSKNLQIVMIYTPPNIPSAADESLLYLVKEVAGHQEVLIAGDFIASTVDWVNLTVDDAPTSLGSILMDLTLDQPLVQKAFHAAADLNLKYCLIAGDFNLPEVHWFPTSGPTKFEDLFASVDHVRSAVENASPVFEYILFSAPLMERELQNLKEAKSSGPDDLLANFLNELASKLFKTLAHIFIFFILIKEIVIQIEGSKNIPHIQE